MTDKLHVSIQVDDDNMKSGSTHASDTFQKHAARGRLAMSAALVLWVDALLYWSLMARKSPPIATIGSAAEAFMPFLGALACTFFYFARVTARKLLDTPDEFRRVFVFTLPFAGYACILFWYAMQHLHALSKIDSTLPGPFFLVFWNLIWALVAICVFATLLVDLVPLAFKTSTTTTTRTEQEQEEEEEEKTKEQPKSDLPDTVVEEEEEDDERIDFEKLFGTQRDVPQYHGPLWTYEASLPDPSALDTLPPATDNNNNNNNNV